MNKKRILIVLLVISALAAGYHFIIQGHNHADHDRLYTCPMHPQIVQNKPGDCPICGMKLVPAKKEEKKAPEKHPKKTMYRSSMNPNEVSDHPGKDSMGMEMIPFEVADTVHKKGPDKSLSGLAPVLIPPEKRQVMGLSFAPVRARTIIREIKTSTKIVPDETRQYRVTSKVGGWIERLYVNQTGQFVKKGQPLCTVYSQELLAAQQEFLSSIKAQRKFSGDHNSPLLHSMEEMLVAARQRLELLDVSERDIARIEKTGKLQKTVTLYSPATGFVTEKMVLKGQKIMMQDALMVIVDLSRVWGEIDIYESDLPYIKKGMRVEVSLSYWPGKLFKGKITFLNPFLSPESRTMKARIEIPNKGLVLKPQMFGEAKLLYGIGKKLAVPESAVMRTGSQDYVFIEGSEDLIVPTAVRLGIRSSDGYYQVLSGLKAGARVVVSANFLVDSESSLKAAFQSATGGHQH